VAARRQRPAGNAGAAAELLRQALQRVRLRAEADAAPLRLLRVPQ
jgi:hypothetical protein